MQEITLKRSGQRDLTLTGEVIAVADDKTAFNSTGLWSEFTLCRTEGGEYVLGVRINVQASSKKSFYEAITFQTAQEATDFIQLMLDGDAATVDKFVEMAAFKDECFRGLRMGRANSTRFPTFVADTLRQALNG